MLIKTLVENTSKDCEIKCEHGLSLYIETANHHILFDTGASNLFIENARKMNVDLENIDTVIISHGHYDHGGGLRDFLDINTKAKIYLNKNSFGKYYSENRLGVKRYIGLDQTLIPNERFIFVNDYLIIDQELMLYSQMQGQQMNSKNNENLYVKMGDEYEKDNFNHEQHLVIKEANKCVLFMGCAHSGVVNIIENLRLKYNLRPTHIIGGFHLYSHSKDEYESEKLIEAIGLYLKKTEISFYTGHCTGLNSFDMIKKLLHDKISYLSTGTEIEI